VRTEDEGIAVPADPAQVDSPASLADLLRALLARQGMTYGDVGRAAERLPKRDGQTQALPRSTISDVLTGKRLPPKDKLLTLLAACRVPPEDVPHWLATWERARGAHLKARPRHRSWWCRRYPDSCAGCDWDAQRGAGCPP